MLFAMVTLVWWLSLFSEPPYPPIWSGIALLTGMVFCIVSFATSDGVVRFFNNWSPSIVFIDRKHTTWSQHYQVRISFKGVNQGPWIMVVKEEYDINPITYSRSISYAKVIWGTHHFPEKIKYLWKKHFQHKKEKGVVV